MTFEAIARRLGVTKQAIIYWYPSKEGLSRALVMEDLSQEADTLVAAVAEAQCAAQAIERFVVACVDRHRRHLAAFRLSYLLAQLTEHPERLMPVEAREAFVYPVTGRYYSALEDKIRADSDRNPALEPRTLAVAVHSAAIGIACMASLMEAMKDSMKGGIDAIVTTLIKALAEGVSAPKPTTVRSRRRRQVRKGGDR